MRDKFYERLRIFKTDNFCNREEIEYNEYNKAQNEMSSDEFKIKYGIMKDGLDKLYYRRNSDTNIDDIPDSETDRAIFLNILEETRQCTEYLCTIKNIALFFLWLAIVMIIGWLYMVSQS